MVVKPKKGLVAIVSYSQLSPTPLVLIPKVITMKAILLLII